MYSRCDTCASTAALTSSRSMSTSPDADAQCTTTSTPSSAAASPAPLYRDGELFTVLTVDASDHGIDQVLWMMNPAKITAASGAAGRRPSRRDRTVTTGGAVLS